MGKFLLKLFISGRTWRAERAIANLRRICDQELEGESEIVIIDVLENPHMAEQARILATPTLIKELPLPQRRIIGDLSDFDKVRKGLDLKPRFNRDQFQGDY
jgi:circadian clock protein KaiB